MPSMVALLGLLAVAGYQNRDKIAEMLGKQGQAGGAGAGGTLGRRIRRRRKAVCSAISADFSEARAPAAY
jgi:uncharacterized protein YidB (DUF937 family)